MTSSVEAVVQPPPVVPASAQLVPQLEATCDLMVRTLPREVEVLIGGRSMGFTTPKGLKLKVAPGDVVVELRHAGYVSQEQRYTATNGRSKTLSVILKRQH